MNEEKITYEEFTSMFRIAPRLVYLLYDKAEDEISRLKGRLEKINCLIHKALNDREINGIGDLNLSMILELTGDNKDV